MADSLDTLAEDGLFYGLHLTGSGNHWSAQMRAEELPSVSGKPMYTNYSASTPEAAIAKAVAGSRSKLEEKPDFDTDDLI